MPLLIEMVVDLGVNRAELLQRLRTSKPLHRPLSSSKRLVRILRPIVEAATEPPSKARQELGRAEARKAHDGRRRHIDAALEIHRIHSGGYKPFATLSSLCSAQDRLAVQSFKSVHRDPRATQRIERDKDKDEALALIRSDLSEALAALRTGGVDDELPHRIEVKLAGALIRIFEYAGAYQLDLDGAVREGLACKEAA
jgi:hypothetical protein